MAGKNRVGSLYMELVLDPSKYAKGASQAVKDHRRMQKELSKAHGGLDPKAKAAADLDLAKKAAVRLIKLKKMTFEQGKAIIRAATANYKAEIKKIDAAAFASDEKRLMHLKEKNDKELADIKKTVREEKRIRDAALASEEAKLKERQAHARRRRRQRVAAEREVDKRVGAIRKDAFAGGMFGSGPIMMGLGKVTRTVGTLTQALFPLAIAGYAAVRMFGVLKRAVVAWVKAADEKTRSMLVLTTLLHGNKEAAAELRAELVKYAKATAFSVEGTMQLAVQMKALGFAATEIPSILAKLGRLSFGDTGKLKLIAKAYSDVRAQGKLLMTEVRQFANQGVPLLAQLQTNLGKTALQVRDDMKDGLITFEQVAKAIDDIAESYGNVDEAGLATVSGQMEAAGEAWNEILAKTGESEALLETAKALNQVLNGLDKVVGETEALDTAVQATGWSMRATLALFTVGLSEAIVMIDYLNRLYSGELEHERKVNELLEARRKKQEKINKLKREELEAKAKETSAANVMIEQERVAEDLLKRKNKLNMEIAAASADPAIAAEGTFQLDKLEREANLQKEILESREKIDKDRKAIFEASGNTELSKEYTDMLDAVAEFDKQTEERLIRAKEKAKFEQEQRDKAKKDAEELAKANKDAAEKKRKQEEEWKRQDIEDAKKLIKRAKDNQEKFEKDQDERNKFDDTIPRSSPAFQANSVAEFMFRKEKEIQREKQREENKREQERREHAEVLNENLILAIEGIGLNVNDNELNFKGIGGN
jgi:tape measure domain-containing protein